MHIYVSIFLFFSLFFEMLVPRRQYLRTSCARCRNNLRCVVNYLYEGIIRIDIKITRHVPYVIQFNEIFVSLIFLRNACISRAVQHPSTATPNGDTILKNSSLKFQFAYAMLLGLDIYRLDDSVSLFYSYKRDENARI